MSQSRPNFVCLVADQLRFDLLSCAGNPIVKTPNIDRLAAGGVRFDRCYTIQPMCMATRATWFTGRTPRGHGVRCNGIPLRRDIPTLGDALVEYGYRTHAVGKIHMNPWMPQVDFPVEQLDPEKWPEAISLWDSGKITRLPQPYYGLQTVEPMIGKIWGDYRTWLLEREPNAPALLKPPENFHSVELTPDEFWPSRLPGHLHHTVWAAERSEAFIKEQAAGENPFFLWCSIPDPHPVYAVAEPYFSMYKDSDVMPPVRREGELADLPPHYQEFFEKGMMSAGRIAATNLSDEKRTGLMRIVYGMVTQWDAMVGRITAALEEHGLLDNTIIVVMSDHGQMLGDHWMYNMPPCHLDGIMRVPSIWYGPKHLVAGVTSQALASNLDFAPTVLDLANVPIPEGDVPPRPEAEKQRPPWPGNSLGPILRGEKDSVQTSVICENDADYTGMRQHTLITEDFHITCYIGETFGELFDLRNDPQQLHNRWNAPEYHEIKRDLQILMMERFAETDSVLPRRLGHA